MPVKQHFVKLIAFMLPDRFAGRTPLVAAVSRQHAFSGRNFPFASALMLKRGRPNQRDQDQVFPLRLQMPPMSTNQPPIQIRRAALIFVAGIIIASCSAKPAPDREKDGSEASRDLMRQSEVETEKLQPNEDKIAEDCAAFVRSTKVVPARAASDDCPGCPAGGTDVLAFRDMKTDSASCSRDTCTVLVTIRAVFVPGAGETIAGGLSAWISPEQRIAYLSGHTPSGEQAYHVRITYKRRGKAWSAVEFDRAPVE